MTSFQSAFKACSIYFLSKDFARTFKGLPNDFQLIFDEFSIDFKRLSKHFPQTSQGLSKYFPRTFQGLANKKKVQRTFKGERRHPSHTVDITVSARLCRIGLLHAFAESGLQSTCAGPALLHPLGLD